MDELDAALDRGSEMLETATCWGQSDAGLAMARVRIHDLRLASQSTRGNKPEAEYALTTDLPVLESAASQCLQSMSSAT